jgi:hypothetical protein
MTRAESLPEDAAEEVDRHVNAVTGKVESRASAIAALRPDLEGDPPATLDDELEAIRQDESLSTSFPSPFTPRMNGGGAAGDGAETEDGADTGSAPDRTGVPIPPAR